MIKKYWKEIILGIGGIVVFIAMAQISQYYSNDLQTMVVQAGIYAPALYMFISFISIVAAPLGAGFLVPVAANAFGPFAAALYSMGGWFFGSLVAFYLARKYGHGRLQQLKMCKKVHVIEKEHTDIQVFWILIALRIGMPVDIFSYALGLFSKISYKMFTSTTLIGILPFAFLFAYASVMPAIYQAMISVFSMVTLLGALYYVVSYQSIKDK